MSNGRSITIAAMLSIMLTACDAQVTPMPAYGASRIWTLTPNGVEVHDARSGAQIASLQLPGWVWADEPYACPPTLAVGPLGEALVSSNVVPILWRIEPASLVVTRHEPVLEDRGRDVGFSGLVWSAPEAAFFALNGLDGSLWRIDWQLERASHVPVTGRLPRGCALGLPADGARRPAQARLCVRTDAGEWTVDLSPDQRSGHAIAASCQAG